METEDFAKRCEKAETKDFAKRCVKAETKEKTWRKIKTINLIQRWQKEKIQKVLALLRFFAYDKKVVKKIPKKCEKIKN